MNERPQHFVDRQFMAEVLLTAVYRNVLNCCFLNDIQIIP